MRIDHHANHLQLCRAYAHRLVCRADSIWAEMGHEGADVLSRRRRSGPGEGSARISRSRQSGNSSTLTALLPAAHAAVLWLRQQLAPGPPRHCACGERPSTKLSQCCQRVCIVFKAMRRENAAVSCAGLPCRAHHICMHLPVRPVQQAPAHQRARPSEAPAPLTTACQATAAGLQGCGFPPHAASARRQAALAAPCSAVHAAAHLADSVAC